MAKIPRIFHFVFGLKPQTEPFHLSHYLCLRSCIDVNKPDAVYFHCRHIPYGEWWDRIKAELIIKTVLKDNFISSYNYVNKELENYRYAHSSDIVRLEALIEYGGIYADIDTLFVNQIPDSFYDKPFIMGREKADFAQEAARLAGGALCNAWIASEKDASFAKIWLEKSAAAFNGTWSAHSTFLPYLLSQQYPSLISVEPERSFFHFDWTKKGITDIFINKITDTQGILSIHLWSHLWWDKKRVDFSYFNHTRLTPAYIRYANSTYASLARKFLPPGLKASRLSFIKECLVNIFQDLKFAAGRRIKR